MSAHTILALLRSLPGRRELQLLLPIALGAGTGGMVLWPPDRCIPAALTAHADAGGGSSRSYFSSPQQQHQQQQRSVLAPGGDSAAGAAQHTSPGPTGDVAAGAAPPALPALLSRVLGGNEFASGGLALMLVGAAAAGARVLLGSALRYAKRHVMVTAEVDSRDDAYRWLMHWLARHPKFAKATSVSVTSNLAGTFGSSVPALPLVQQGAAGADDAGDGEPAPPPVAFLPAPGDHLLRHNGRWMLISRQRSAGNPQLAANARLLMETMRISMLGTDRRPLERLIAEAAAAYSASQSCRTAVHSVDGDGYWQQLGSRPVRPLDTVILPEGQAEMLLADCQEFMLSEEWYSRVGTPWRRGYLLFGPPGTGKTSTVMALAGALALDIYVVTLSSPSLTDEALRSLLNTAGPRSILLLEDVDAAFVDRSASSQGGAASNLTFSGLLNAIDGVAAQEGRLLFLTTNHKERLSPALIRPGRVDVQLYLGPASRQQALALFQSFYRDRPCRRALTSDKAAAAGGGGAPPALLRSATLDRQSEELASLAQQFAACLPETTLSTAQIQGFLMRHRAQPEAAVAAAGSWVAAQLAGSGQSPESSAVGAG